MEDRVSLHGPDPEAVLRALLKVDPDDNEATEKDASKGTTDED